MRVPTLALLGLLLVPPVILSMLPRPAASLALPAEGNRQRIWTVDLPTPAPAWPDQTRMPFDRVPEPLLRQGRLFHGCTRTDSVVARNPDTGEELWRFTTAGPVRLPLTGWGDLVYAASDDGYLYALEAASGALRWKVRGGPSERKILGNERLISAWPARGGPVVVPATATARPTVYFAAGIWPFMGIFLHAVDAETGAIQWTCDGEGARYMKQPHNAEAFAGVAPQGQLVVAGDLLLLPGGRSVPAAYNRHTGEFVHFRLADYGKTGNSEVQATDNVYFCGDSAFAADSGTLLSRLGDPYLVDGNRLFAWSKGILTEYDLNVPLLREQGKDRKGKVVVNYTWKPRRRVTIPLTPAPLALRRQGEQLFVALPDRVIALALPLKQDRGTPIWQERLKEVPRALVTDERNLFVVGEKGRLQAFACTEEQGTAEPLQPVSTSRFDDREAAGHAGKLLETTGQRAGYALLCGESQTALAGELVRQSSLRVVLTVADAKQVEAIREQARTAALFGDRLTILHGTAKSLDLPPYFANLVVVENADDASAVFPCLRPHGGTLVAPVGQVEPLRQAHPTLPVSETPLGTLLVRKGPLPGAGNWTHENGDAAGTRLSRDRIVKAPLGLLWFGGPSHEGILPRHGHGPSPQVIDGRAIIEGMNLLRAMDIYTGRFLWETKLPGLGKLYDNTSHQPGANASGGNFVSLSDGIYVAHGKNCLRLDPETGREIGRFTIPALPGLEKNPLWSYVNVAGDYLIGGTRPDNPGGSRTKPAAPSSSKILFVFHRQTGKFLWSATATSDGWRHNGICLGGGRLYAIDRPSPTLLGFLKIPKNQPETVRLVAFDLATGRKMWNTTEKVFGTILSYSEERDVLIEAGRVARDSLRDESKGMRAYRGQSGEVLWFQPEYGGPCLLHGDEILFGANSSGKACSLLTGKTIQKADPLTGESVDWTWARQYGCNTPIASENLITFRSGAAGFYDLCQESGTGNLGGFRSGCTNNLLAAGGLLVVPDYTRTCTCSYQNQCSVALVPMPDADLWTYQGGSSTIKGTIRRLGLLLGAPGNRKAENGTLWLEYPSSGSPGPKPEVTITPTPTYFRRHSTQITGEPAWIGAAGAVGLKTLRVTLGPAKTPGRRCTVRLFFVEPDEAKPGERLFAVALNGKTVLPALDVRAEAGAPWKLVEKRFTGITIADKLDVRFTPKDREHPAVLCGIEIVQE